MFKQPKLRILGYFNYLKLNICEYLVRFLNTVFKLKVTWLISLKIKKYKHPIYLRCGTSDYSCFHVIFIQEEYKPIIKAINSKLNLMIDCGLNIGYTSRYFIEIFPDLEIIGFEPDYSNYAIAKLNLQYYQKQILLQQKAVWYKTTKMIVKQGSFGNGGKWALQVKESDLPGAVSAVDLNTVLLDNNKNDCSFIKIDIEGAENEVLANNTSWIEKCNYLAIELHDEVGQKVFKQFVEENKLKEIGLFGEMYLIKNTN